MEIVIGALIFLLIVQEIFHQRERKDLYNRIMAKDLPEYKYQGKPVRVKNIIKKNLERQRQKSSE